MRVAPGPPLLVPPLSSPRYRASAAVTPGSTRWTSSPFGTPAVDDPVGGDQPRLGAVAEADPERLRRLPRALGFQSPPAAPLAGRGAAGPHLRRPVEFGGGAGPGDVDEGEGLGAGARQGSSAVACHRQV